MTVARSVADVLTEHVRFQVECIDRMFLNVYVPQLQYPAGLVGYVHRRLGLPIASTAPLARITDAFCAAVRRFAPDNAIPWVDFVKGQRKDDVMHEHLQRFAGSFSFLVLLLDPGVLVVLQPTGAGTAGRQLRPGQDTSRAHHSDTRSPDLSPDLPRRTSHVEQPTI